ncbi:hypothetical protein E2562_002962 [Oryza meyeriana var. granulata]|uniref:Uncharacterized protein n=1 Tax=Oryza meyeriana var. granulata TaxID=110450 RepID=A0A6G1DE92_9ORYZ|nr:hypothetical protein E2562_002962 [Oryza meyeriana var. granulata]
MQAAWETKGTGRPRRGAAASKRQSPARGGGEPDHGSRRGMERAGETKGAGRRSRRSRRPAQEIGAVVAIWKPIHRPESTVETSDSSHSDIGSTSQSGFRTLGGRDAVSDESGGVMGALLETRSGGRLGSPQRNGRRQEGLGLSSRLGLGKLDDAGLAC